MTFSPPLPLRTGEQRSRWTIFFAAAAVLIIFAFVTDNRWEDYYITFRSSKNLATGLGLVYQAGERVHTFTSPLGVLLPALASAVAGPAHDDTALWLFRAASIGAFGIAAVLLWDLTGAWHWSRFSRIFVVAALATDAKSVEFSINGMETAFMLLFLALALHTLATGGRGAAWRLGLACGGLMWTRPDSIVYVAGLTLGCFAVVRGQAIAGDRRALLAVFGRAAVVCTVVYLPWLLFAWSYYGSIIPNTVVAKGLGLARPDFFALAWDTLLLPFRTMTSSPLDATFAPAYYGCGGWYQLLVQLGRGMAWLALILCFVPRARPEAKMTSVAFFASAVYLRHIWSFPWYSPPSALLAIIALGGWSEFVRTLPTRWPLLRPIASVPFLGMLAMTSALLVGVAWQTRCQQQLVEGQRRRIGEWLKIHRDSEHDRVFLEPIGYIGYFSQLKIVDIPGLTSPEVIAARRRLGNDSQTLIGDLAPTWVVGRPGEPRTSRPSGESSPFAANYAKVARFSVEQEIRAIPFLPGRSYLLGDAIFDVYHRRSRGVAEAKP